MALPSAATKTHLDNGGDDPAQARAELASLVDKFNDLLTHFGLTTITSAPASATGGLEVSGTSLRTSLSFSAQTGAYTALAADRGKVINFTTAGVTLGFTAAATLGDGWWCEVRNSAASGDITLDPNGSETINGATSIVLGPGEMAFVFCNGAGFVAFVSRVPATQAEMEAASSGLRMVTPANLNWHPGVAKAWVRFTAAGAPSILAGHNVASITDNGVGDFTVNWTTPFSSANYSVVASSSAFITRLNVITANGAQIQTFSSSFGGSDPGIVTCVAFGDQ